MEQALTARSRDEAWRALEPLRGSLEGDRDLALTWLTLLAVSPSRPGALDDARAVLARRGDDAEIVRAALAVLLAIADRVPFDEPRPPGDSAQIAVDEARAALARHPDDAALHAALGNALVRLGPSQDAAAIASLEEAIRREPRGEWLSDLGVAHKRARRFLAAQIAFEKARAKLGDLRPILFHLALCGVANGEHDAARSALEKLGFRVEGTGRPFVPDLPETAVRLTTREAGSKTAPVELERAFVQLLSPVHGVLRTPMRGDSVADFGDVLLLDPAPVASTMENGERRPVLGVLGVLAPGDERRIPFLALEQKAGEAAALGASLPEGCLWYVHGTRVESVCPRCAAGDAMQKHEHLPAEEHRAVYGKLVVPASIALGEVRSAIERARSAHPGVLLALPRLHELLGDTPQAGKAHKTWGVIERGMLAARSKA